MPPRYKDLCSGILERERLVFCDKAFGTFCPCSTSYVSALRVTCQELGICRDEGLLLRRVHYAWTTISTSSLGMGFEIQNGLILRVGASFIVVSFFFCLAVQFNCFIVWCRPNTLHTTPFSHLFSIISSHASLSQFWFGIISFEKYTAALEVYEERHVSDTTPQC